ncbi:major facilitator superfamily-like protein [Aureococcus anophagefferens]|nr:major facilitator superfamily-like protein [Aureococcus anophagefferens]
MCRPPPDKLSRAEAPFPWRPVFVLALGGMTHFYAICSLFSYAGFLCVDLGWSATVDEAGYLAGYLGSALTFGRLFTAVLWGRVADKWGRRPALLLTLFGYLVGNLAFGFCRRLPAALAVRAVFLGAGSGWVSLSGLYAGEVAGAERQNLVNSYLLSGGTLTQLLAPAAAALLYGRIAAFPALAPSLLGAGLALANLILGLFWLDETFDAADAARAAQYGRVGDVEDDAAAPLRRGRRRGAAAVAACLFTSTVMAKCMGRLGQRRSLAVGTLVGAASLAAVPFAGGLAARPFAVKLVVLALPLCGYYASGCSNFAAGSAVVNNVVPAERRGAANGVACMVEAVGKAVGPSVGATGLAIGLAAGPRGAAPAPCAAPAAANVTEFLGVPFAAPPLRFADAAAAAPWNGTRVAPPAARASGGSEDCLYVNAYSTMVPGRPVMVYVHGGGFVSGAATRSAANLTRLTGSVVFAQYRLGVLGFFGGDNRGLGDQLRALAWVRDNCAAFGATRRVMVFGVSAGASVAHLLVEPSAAGLFSAAALESPGGHQGWMAPGARPDDDFAAPAVVANASAAAAAPGCAVDDFSCLRAAPLAALLAAAKGARFAPSLKRARPADDRSADGVSENEYASALARHFAGAAVDAAAIASRYAGRAAAEGRWRAFARILSDSGHACSSQLHARALAATTTFAYYFSEPGASAHGQDESYLATPAAATTRSPSTWPRGGRARRGAPVDWWPPFLAPGDRVMGLHEAPALVANDDTHRPECDDFWAPWLGFY